MVAEGQGQDRNVEVDLLKYLNMRVGLQSKDNSLGIWKRHLKLSGESLAFRSQAEVLILLYSTFEVKGELNLRKAAIKI